MPLLEVMLAAPADAVEADAALTALRRAMPRQMEAGRAVLLFCDLPDAPHIRMPQDDALLRRLQSGVMSIERRRPGRAMLLVRRRAWDDAARMYLGPGQATPAHRVIAQLLADGRTDASFDAASVSPRSLAGRFDAVLMTDVSLSRAPDVPARMLTRLRASRAGCVRAPIVHAPTDAEPLIGRLLRVGFSLAPLLPAHEPVPLMATPAALRADALPDCPVAGDCAFVTRDVPAMDELLARARSGYRQCGAALPLLLPIAQLAALLLAAALGSEALACLALIAPELSALRHPTQLPGALVRLTLLPALAMSALDARLSQLLSRSPRLRVALPEAAKRPSCCVLFGAVLLAIAIVGAHALVPLLPVSLLWLFAPVIVRALDTPVRERIPLTQDERLVLRGDAEAQYAALIASDAGSAALRMLCDCAACLLGLLEPDEAARRAEARLPALKAQLDAPSPSALAHAAALTCAQLLRERMAQCDAALRPLPGQIEAVVLAAPAPRGQGLLSRVIRAALFEDSAPFRAPREADDPADALFLPLSLLRVDETPAALLPLTHPHTYVVRRGLPAEHSRALHDEKLPGLSAEEREMLFLSLTSAALDGVWIKLFERSPIAAPVMPALAAQPPREDAPPRRSARVRIPRTRPRAAQQ